MSEFRIFETDNYLSCLEKLRKDLKAKIYKKIYAYVYPQIKENPFVGKNIKKLRDYRPETWRYRIGDYRIFYEVDDRERIINIITIELRDRAY